MCTSTLRERCPDTYMNYEESLKDYRDMYSVMKTQLEKGREEGRAEGRAEGREEERLNTARKMETLGIASEIISQITGLNSKDIENL